MTAIQASRPVDSWAPEPPPSSDRSAVTWSGRGPQAGHPDSADHAVDAESSGSSTLTRLTAAARAMAAAPPSLPWPGPPLGGSALFGRDLAPATSPPANSGVSAYPEPLLPAASRGGPEDAAQAAAMLREQIAHSGLFYESRLARWVAGELPMDELVRSPQVTGNAAAAGGGVDARGALSTLAHAQLALLMGGELHWEGMAWPGQRYRLWLHDGGAAHGQEPRAWRLQLAVDLPNLGAVAFNVVLRGNRIAISGVATESASGDHLTAAAADLARRLSAGHLHVGGLHFTVTRDAAGAR